MPQRTTRLRMSLRSDFTRSKTSVPEGYQPALTANTSVRLTIVEPSSACQYSERVPGPSSNVRKSAWCEYAGGSSATFAGLFAKRDFQFCGPRFIQIITRQMSAGETPEIRDACPSVIGRISLNFLARFIRKLAPGCNPSNLEFACLRGP